MPSRVTNSSTTARSAAGESSVWGIRMSQYIRNTKLVARLKSERLTRWQLVGESLTSRIHPRSEATFRTEKPMGRRMAVCPLGILSVALDPTGILTDTVRHRCRRRRHFLNSARQSATIRACEAGGARGRPAGQKSSPGVLTNSMLTIELVPG